MTKLRTQQTRAPRGTFDMLASVALALSFVAPALRPIEAGAWTRSAWARMDYAIDKAGTLGKDIHALEDKCAAGEMDACVMLDQLSGYAQTLNDMNKRLGKPPDAPSFVDALAHDARPESTAPIGPRPQSGPIRPDFPI